MPRAPTSLWQSSPLAGLDEPDDLRLSAATRHHLRNIAKREQEAEAQAEANLGTSPLEPEHGSTALDFDRPGHAVDDAAEQAGSPLRHRQRGDERGDAEEDRVDPGISSMITSSPIQECCRGRSTEARDELFAGSSPSPSPKSPPPPDDTAENLNGNDDEADDEMDYESNSGLSMVSSSADLCTEHVEDAEPPLAEEPTQAMPLFPSAEYQHELHKIYALLRTLIQVDPDVFAVVDHYEFTQVLSCSGMPREEMSKLDVILRLRQQLTYRPPQPSNSQAMPKERILLPFL